MSKNRNRNRTNNKARDNNDEKEYNIKTEFKKTWFLLALIAAMFIVSIVVYSDLPEKVPMHWNLQGEVDDYVNHFWGAFMLPLIGLGIFLLMLVAPLIDPSKNNYSKFSKIYRLFRIIMIVFIAVLHFVVISAALGYNLDIGRIIVLVLAIFYLVFGNYMPRIRHNYFLGIKSPWTLDSEKVWRKTHRFTGKLFLASGIIMLISVLFGDIIRFILVMVSILGSSIAGIVYSYFVYREEEDL
ncbi:MAG: SdpI family protein [Halanaerobiales bacterium]